jgi:hypothetical protein
MHICLAQAFMLCVACPGDRPPGARLQRATSAGCARGAAGAANEERCGDARAQKKECERLCDCLLPPVGIRVCVFDLVAKRWIGLITADARQSDERPSATSSTSARTRAPYRGYIGLLANWAALGDDLAGAV